MITKSKCLILIGSFLSLSLLFVNCSPLASSKLDTSSNPLESANNGGGHQGKVVYRHTSAFEGCDVAPELQLEFDGDQVHSFTSFCHNKVETAFDPLKFVSFLNDPYFIVYDDLIYADDTALALQKTEQAQIELFCTSDKVDLAVKIARFHVKPAPYMQTTGLLIDKSAAGGATIGREIGTLTEPVYANGAHSFKPDSGAYVLDIAASSSPTRTTAQLTYKSGEQIQMMCYSRNRAPGN